MTRKITNVARDAIFCFFQAISLALMLLLRPVIRASVSKPDALKVPRGTLLIANHQSKLDPWLVCSYLGLGEISPILPIRFPVTPSIIRRPFGWLLWFFGCFDVGFTELEKAKKLIYIRDLVYRQYSVLIFPEGKVIKSSQEKSDFKRGINMLSQENTPLLLIRITGMDSFSFFRPDKNKVAIQYSDILQNIPAEEKSEIILNFFNK